MTLREIQKKIAMCDKIHDDNFDTCCIDIRGFKDYIFDVKEYLSSEELKRSERINFKKTKEFFCLRKGLIRIVLSNYLNIHPKEIEYFYTRNGKPYFSQKIYKDIYFNISHSKELLLVGISTKGNIGVDVEKLNMGLNVSLLAESVLSLKEMNLWRHLDQDVRVRSYYKAWVQKEAISKALGVGISIGFNKFSVNLDPAYRDESYTMGLNDLEFRMNVKQKDDYFLAIAMENNHLD